ncbi:MAG TPA: oligosaccharide flippase family protein [Candidatus Acidoferrales bacterium]|nr:oligosaccharide flippase family protein [Candidatus Acidoferrales bacterium]
MRLTTEMENGGSSEGKSVGGTGRKLAYGSALRVASLGATGLVSVLIMPFVVRSLGDRLYGIWTLVATFVGYYGLLDLGLSGAVSRFIAGALGSEDEEQCNRVFNTALMVFSAIAVVLVVFGSAVAALAPLFCRSPDDAALFWRVILILTFSLALGFPLKVFIGALEAHLRFDSTAALELLSLSIRTALVIATLLCGYKVVGLAWATFFAGIPSAVLYVYLSHRNLPFLRIDRKYWSRATAKSLFSYSAFSAILQLANIIRFDVDALVIAAYVSLAAVTHFRIASALVQNFLGLITAIVGVFSFVFSRQDGARDFEAIKKTFFFATKISACVSSFVGFGLIAWGKPFIARWMGPQYLDAYPCLVILVLGYIFALWQTPSVSLFYGISRHKVFAIFTCAEALANLLLSLLLVRSYGIFGVAFGTFLPMVLVKLLIQPLYACHVLSVCYTDYLCRMGKTLALIAGSLVVPFLLSAHFASPDYKSLFALGIASMLCYSLPLMIYEFTPAERTMLQQAIFPR